MAGPVSGSSYESSARPSRNRDEKPPGGAARLWLLDQLVAEEEKAIVRRGYAVTWNARRRYPRALRAEIPIVVTYQVPFLQDDGRHVGPANLEWSHRMLGARTGRARRVFPLDGGDGCVACSIFPGDFDTNGPHRLVLQTRVRTAGLTDSWEIDLPQVPFTFEFDPILRLEAILTLADATRDESVARAIRLEPLAAAAGERSTYLSLGDEWTLRNPPDSRWRCPFPATWHTRSPSSSMGSRGRSPAVASS